MKTTIIGRWAFIGGIILSLLAGFSQSSVWLTVLFVLGLIVGFLNIAERESVPFLVAVITLLLIGAVGLQAGKLAYPALVSILNNFVAFVAAAGLVVAIKQIVATAKPNA